MFIVEPYPLAYRRLAAAGRSAPLKGMVLSVVAGVLMGWFDRFVAQSIGADTV